MSIINLVSIPLMSVADKRAARDRLLAIDGLEAGKCAREEVCKSFRRRRGRRFDVDEGLM